MIYTLEQLKELIAPIAEKYRLSAVYLFGDLEDALQKRVDLITISALQQRAQLPSEQDFRQTVMRERVKLYAVA